jgi:hypothetical protein
MGLIYGSLYTFLSIGKSGGFGIPWQCAVSYHYVAAGAGLQAAIN